MKLPQDKVVMSEINDKEMVHESDKYGVPVTVRISAEMKKELADEAAIRGISLAQHGANLLLTCHKKSTDRTAEVNLLLQERENLKKRIEALEKEKAQYKGKEGEIIDTLRKNQRILKQYQTNIPTPKKLLLEVGFDFFFATHTGLIDGKPYYCVFDMGFRKEGENIIIKPLS